MKVPPNAATIEAAKREKWYRADPSHILHAGQRKVDKAFKEAKGQLFVANVSRQFGKSYWAVYKAVAFALSKPKARIKYATAFHSDLIELILPNFEAVLSTCPDSIRPRYKVNGSKWVFKNGAEIKLVGLDRSPNGIRGNTIDLIVIDEAAFIMNLEYIYSSVIIPATLRRPDCRVLMISTPPVTPAHPFGDFIQRAEVNNAYIKLTIYENPQITQEDIDRMAREMGGYESTMFRRECLCELVLEEELALVDNWKPEFEQEVPKDEFYPYYHRYVSMDMGRKDHTALVFGYYDYKRAQLVIDDELTMDGPAWTTVTLKDAITNKEKELWGETKPFRRIADNNNPHLILDLTHLHNLSFMETDKESLEAMVNHVRILIDEGRIRVNPRCKMLLGCLKYGVWDEKRKEFGRSKVLGHFDHFAALMYLVRNVAYHSNPIPALHGATHRTWIYNVSKETNNQRELKRALMPRRKII